MLYELIFEGFLLPIFSDSFCTRAQGGNRWQVTVVPERFSPMEVEVIDLHTGGYHVMFHTMPQPGLSYILNVSLLSPTVVNRYSANPNGTLGVVRELVDTSTMLFGMPLMLHTVQNQQVTPSTPTLSPFISCEA